MSTKFSTYILREGIKQTEFSTIMNNTQKSGLLRFVFWGGTALLLWSNKESVPQHELLGILAGWEIVIASCPWFNTKE